MTDRCSDWQDPSAWPARRIDGKRVLVCGGRDYDDRDHIWNTLCDLNSKRGPFAVIIHGCATGADHEAMIWAQTLPGRHHAPFQTLTAPAFRQANPSTHDR